MKNKTLTFVATKAAKNRKCSYPPLFGGKSMVRLFALVALLCVSVMGWAVDQDTWIGTTDATYANQFKWSEVSGVTMPSSVVEIHKDGFASEIGLYVTFPVADFNAVYYNGTQKTQDIHYAVQGAGISFFISSLTEKNTEIILKNGETIKYGLNIYNEKGEDGGSTPDPVDPTPDPDPEPATDGEKFVAANYDECSSYFATPNWNQEYNSTASCTDGVITVNIKEAKGAQWHAQVSLTLDFDFAANKYYDFSIKFHSNNAVNQVSFKPNNKSGDNEMLAVFDIAIPANEDYVYTKTDVAGTANDSRDFLLDFGYASVGTTITISEISIIEKDAPSVEPAAFSIKETWPTDRVIASMNDGDVNVKIASYGGAQWNGQLKLQHLIAFENTKAYKVAFTLTADKDCGGITFKTDNNTESVYENQSINLTANTPFQYEKVFSGQTGNDKIMVFDFGWVGENTNITISDLSLIEYSPATASSTNGDLIPFKAVDGKAATCWQAATTGEQWWKMDYGTAQSFNRVNITWETSYAKSFTIQGSNDDENYTVLKTISGQTLDNPNNYKQVIDLDQIYNFRYVKFVGTENGNGYGFSFYEFEVMEVETSVLTSVVITSPKRKTVCAVGSSIDITAVASDQYDLPMGGQAIRYSVSPATAGTIDDNGHYTANQVGEATITAACSDKQASYVVVNTISANLALNKPSTAGANETPIAEANDANLNSHWALGPNQPEEKMWWCVDLEDTYDLSLVIIKWEGACPTEHKIQVSNDNTEWTDATESITGWPEIGAVDDHNYQFYSLNTTGRYIRVKASALRENGWGMKIYDFQAFGVLAATPTKTVSASVNDAAMGSATVQQNGVDVTEVETGTEVTFSAVAEDGYVFVNWSNGNTDATFTTTVDATMNLTANFRAMGNVYCNTLVHSSNGGQEHDAYVTMKRTAANTYQLIVRAEYELGNFSNTEFRIKEEGAANTSNFNLNNNGILSDGNHTLTGTIISTVEPEMISGKLYVNIVGQWEGQFDRLTNIEYAVACDDNVSVTSIELSQTSAKLLVDKTLTLTPTFAPAYATDKALTWETTNESVATVVDGVVTAKAVGTATITAKLTSDNSISATCNVTVVDALTEATWHGYGVATPPTEKNVVFTYAITRDVEQHLTFSLTTDKNMVGFVSFININGTDHQLAGYGADLTAAYTTEDTYEDNVALNCMWDVRGANFRETYNFTYMVGSENAEPKLLILNETQDNTSALTPLDGQEVAAVSVNRSFAADNLYTLVLPFDADAAQTAEKLPGKLTKLNNTYVKENKDLRVNFVDAETIEAGVPYLYSPSEDVVNPVFTGVTISSALRPTAPTGEKAAYYGIYAPLDGVALHNIANGYVLGSDQYLYPTSSLANEQTMKALRGYFVLDFPANTPSGVRARVVFNSQETEVATGIGDVQSDNVPCTKVLQNGVLLIIRDGKTYNAQGQLVK